MGATPRTSMQAHASHPVGRRPGDGFAQHTSRINDDSHSQTPTPDSVRRPGRAGLVRHRAGPVLHRHAAGGSAGRLRSRQAYGSRRHGNARIRCARLGRSRRHRHHPLPDIPAGPQRPRRRRVRDHQGEHRLGGGQLHGHRHQRHLPERSSAERRHERPDPHADLRPRTRRATRPRSAAPSRRSR